MNFPKTKAWISLWCAKYTANSNRQDSDDDDSADSELLHVRGTNDGLDTTSSSPCSLVAPKDHLLSLGRAKLREKLGFNPLASSDASKWISDAWNHQAKDTPLFKVSDKIRVIESNEASGRYCVAAKQLDVADLVVQCDAYSWILEEAEKGRRCEYCLDLVSDELKTTGCPRCKDAVFCNAACRSLAETLEIHSEEDCKFASILFNLNEPGPAYLPLAFRTFLQLERKTPNYSWHQTRLILSLESNLDKLPPREAYNLSRTLVFVSQHFRLSTAEESLLAQLAAVIRCNSFAIKHISQTCSMTMEIVDEKLGTALFPEASLLNHGCAPSCSASFREPAKGKKPGIAIRATEKVSKGGELSISYGPTVWRIPKGKERRRVLWGTHLFDCACSVCLLPDSIEAVGMMDDEGEMVEVDLKAQRLADKGRYLESSRLLQSNLSQIRRKYGQTSIEHARELCKLLSVCLADGSGRTMREFAKDPVELRAVVRVALASVKAGSFDGTGGEEGELLRAVVGMLGAGVVR